MSARDAGPARAGTTALGRPAAPRAPETHPAAPPGTIPTQRTRPAPVAPAPAAPGRRRRTGGTVAVVLLCATLVGAVAAGVVVQLRADARAAAWAHVEERAALLDAAQRVDAEFAARTRAAAAAARYDALVADAVARAGTALTAAQAAAAASPHAGEPALAALRAATDALSAAAGTAGTGTSPATLAARTAEVAAPQQAAVEAQAAWQAAEDARIAAERAAAERAAAERAAAEAAQRSRGSGSGGTAAAAPAAAAAAPAATWAAGVQSYGVSGLGSALNAARADAGLGALTVVRSASLADHAAAMAAAGSIWHSGNDHIVGWVQPASDAEMIAAYLNSPPHRAWILKEGKSTVSIGAVTLNGRLYTAMRFS
jgi:hypothetical protein